MYLIIVCIDTLFRIEEASRIFQSQIFYNRKLVLGGTFKTPFLIFLVAYLSIKNTHLSCSVYSLQYLINVGQIIK